MTGEPCHRPARTPDEASVAVLGGFPVRPSERAADPGRVVGAIGTPPPLGHLQLTERPEAVKLPTSPEQDRLNGSRQPTSTGTGALIIRTPEGARIAILRSGTRYAAVSDVIEGIVIGDDPVEVISAAAVVSPTLAWVLDAAARAIPPATPEGVRS